MRARWVVLGVAAVLGAGAAGYKLTQPHHVTVGVVVRGSAIEAVYASGTVEAVNRVEVKAKVPGPVAELLVREGDRVQQGQLLARIEAPTLGYDVERGRADLSAALRREASAPQIASLRAQEAALTTEVAQARTDLARAQQLRRTGASPQTDVDRARVNLESLEGQLAANRATQRDIRITLQNEAQRQQAGLASLESRESDADVRSPLDGVVLARHVERGEVVGINENLVRVGDVSHLQIESQVDEADVGRVRVGQPAAVRLYAFEGRVFRGRVVRILPDADRERKAFEVDVVLDESPEGLRPGMTADVNVIVQEHDGVLLAPSDAVRGGRVWVVGTDRRVHAREVAVGIRDLARVELVRGARAGERVVLGEPAGLREGTRVVPMQQATPR